MRDNEPPSRRAWPLPALLLILLLVALASLSLRPVQSGQHVAAVFPPWWDTVDALRAVAVADGRIVGVGAWPNLPVVAASGDVVPRLRAAGAWVLFDAATALGCSPPSPLGS